MTGVIMPHPAGACTIPLIRGSAGRNRRDRKLRSFERRRLLVGGEEHVLDLAQNLHGGEGVGDRAVRGALAFDGGDEIAPEVGEHRIPFGAAARHVVQLFLELGGGEDPGLIGA